MITSSKMQYAAVECGRRKRRRAIGRKNHKITMKHEGNDELASENYEQRETEIGGENVAVQLAGKITKSR
ncbi:hypothetical protein P8452_72222 [Trifolium repens]|nr:hypothetical protein P8452_72222 [Trifolium repens]